MSGTAVVVVTAAAANAAASASLAASNAALAANNLNHSSSGDAGPLFFVVLLVIVAFVIGVVKINDWRWERQSKQGYGLSYNERVQIQNQALIGKVLFGIALAVIVLVAIIIKVA